jgi:hypothetical protein
MDDLLTKWLQSAGAGAASIPVAVLLPRMLAALVIGVALAVRPWRLVTGKPLPRAEMIQAQILLCAAAAVITIVIGDSLAKAFGLVGLGSFVRFRSGLKDPRDAAVLFLVIGLGMACGHGAVAMALAATAFLAVVLAVLDLFKVPEPALEEDGRKEASGAPQLALASRSQPVNGAVAAAVPAAPGASAP